MSRAKRIRMRRVQRNRRIALVIGMVLAALLVSLAFGNLNVMAQKPVTYKYYTDIRVGRDDTLWSIAQQFSGEEYRSLNDYIREVCEINDLGGEVQYGQRLMVPYYSEEMK